MVRRKLAKSAATQHKRRKADGSTRTWLQKPDIAVRERLLRDED